MAILYICKQCKGAGKTEKKLLFISKKVSCRFCKGAGRKKYVKDKAI